MDKVKYAYKPLIAICGSAGKTTVKAMLSAILRERWVVFESRDYYNTPDKTLLHAEQIGSIHLAAVLEYGMGYAGGITEHCSILQPNIGLITNVGYAHIGNFDGDITQLAAAKAELIYGLDPQGCLVINADDQNSQLLPTAQYPGNLLRIACAAPADYQAEEVECTAQGINFRIKLHGQVYQMTAPVLGRHNVYNALMAIAVADYLDFTPHEIQSGLRKARYPRRRLELYPFAENITVIDDTVHAHPTAMQAALEVLADFPAQQKIAVLGSMPALGVLTEQAHEDLGRYFATKPIDALLTYGIASALIGQKAIEAGYPEAQVEHFTPLYRRVLHRKLTAMLKPGTVVLVKGASRQNMFETVKFLRDHLKVKR